jgi:predicted nucleic acid-binding protein
MLVIPEAAYLLRRDLGTPTEIALLGDILDGALTPVPVEPSDWARIIDLVWTYRDLPLGTVDASVVAAAERLEVPQIATLDHRDFSVVRPAHVDAFELLP